MQKLILFSQAVLILILIAFTSGIYGWKYPMHHNYGGSFMWFIFLIIAGIIFYFIFQNSTKSNSDTFYRENPIDILKKLYANVEIKKDEYEKIKNELQ